MGIKLPRGFCAGCGARIPKNRKRCPGCRPGRTKYGSRRVKVVIPGEEERWFDSEKEADHYAKLLALERAGMISDLQLQVPFPLLVNGVQVARYVADFVYLEKGANAVWTKVVEDTKGYRTRYYKLIAKMFLAQYGFSIREV